MRTTRSVRRKAVGRAEARRRGFTNAVRNAGSRLGALVTRTPGQRREAIRALWLEGSRQAGRNSRAMFVGGNDSGEKLIRLTDANSRIDQREFIVIYAFWVELALVISGVAPQIEGFSRWSPQAWKGFGKCTRVFRGCRGDNLAMNTMFHTFREEKKPGKRLLEPGHESRLPAYVALIATMALQRQVPKEFSPTPSRNWLTVLMGIEVLLLLLLILSNHAVKAKWADWEIGLARLLLVVITIDNAASAARLDYLALHEGTDVKASHLLIAGGTIFLTNVIVVGIWYWFHDLGGPQARERGIAFYPDFLFPQYGQDENTREFAPADWRPKFLDYFYISFTNVVAFSPTDVLPLTRRAKAMMALQSAVSVTTLVVVVARAINVLK